jgi:GTPase SAR1 family protein
MIIEFLGLPGSGKSSLIKHIISNEPNSKDVLVGDLFSRIFFCILFSFKHPVKTVFWSQLLFDGARSYSMFRYKFHLLSKSIAKTEKARHVQAKDIYIDEGLFQRALSLFENVMTESDLAKILKYIPLPDIIVTMEGGEFDRFLRYEDSADSPRKSMGQEYFDRWIKVLQSNYGIMYAYIKSGPIKTININNIGRPSFTELISVFDKARSAML